MKKLFLLILLFFPLLVYGADTKVSDLTADSSPGTDSLTYTVDDPAGTPVSRKTTIGELFSAATDLDANGVISANSVALGTDTTGNYAAGDAEAGAATSGDSATSFFSSGTLEVGIGGTGATTFTDGGILLGSGAGAITALGAAANGEIPIGDGTTDPQLGTISGTASEIDITNGAGSITVGIVDPLAVAKGGTGQANLNNLITLTTHTTGNYVQDVADGTGIDGTASGEGATYTPTFDATELDALTWSDNANASNIWTFDVSGTDHTMTAGSGMMTFSHDITITGDDLFMNTNTDRFALLGDGTNYNPEAIDLGTDTTGNYAAGDAEAGAATSGDSATAFFGAGTIEHERGGLEADVSAYSSIVGINGGSTLEVNTSSEVATLIDDETGSGALAFGTSPTFLTNVTLPISSAPTTSVSGQVAIDSNGTADLVSGIVQINQNDGTLYLFPLPIPTSGQDNYIQKYDAGANRISWEADATGAGSGAFSDAADPVVLNTTTKDVVIGTAQVNTSKLTVDGDADQVQLTIQGNAAQADSIVIIENSGGTEVANIDNDGTILTAVGLDAIGNVDMDYGSADVDDHTFITDGTGNAEIVLPNDSIGPAEIDSTTGAYDFGGVTSFEITNGASPTVDVSGEIAVDTTSGQLKYFGNATTNIIHPKRWSSVVVENLAAADDNFEIGMFNDAVTITDIGVHCRGTCSTSAQISLEDRSGNAMTHTTPTASVSTNNTTFQSVTANNTLVAGEGLAFDVDNAVSPETDEYTITIGYTITAD